MLNDSVRVLDRHLARLKAAAPELVFAYHRRTRRAKKRTYQIVMLKGKNIARRRREYYVDLLAVQEQVRGYAAGALAALASAPGVAARLEVMEEAVELEAVLPLAERVHDQARRRVLEGEKVPADEKLVSIFETHTDIICRGKKGSKTEFGHKLHVATGRSGLITWYEVLKGNPGDNELLLGALEGHVAAFGQAPQKVTADRRYYSADNETEARALGVEQVARAAQALAPRAAQARLPVERAAEFAKIALVPAFAALARRDRGLPFDLAAAVRPQALLVERLAFVSVVRGAGRLDLQPAPARGAPDADVVLARATGASEKKTKRPERPRGN